VKLSRIVLITIKWPFNNKKIIIVSSRHTYGNITKGTIDDIVIDTTGIPKTIDIDEENKLVTVSPSVSVKECVDYLGKRNWTLLNIGWIKVQTIPGAVSTGTHASSFKSETFSEQLYSYDFIDANGVKHTIDKSSRNFNDMNVSLGIFGFITSIKLYIVPLFYLREVNYWTTFDEFINIKPSKDLFNVSGFTFTNNDKVFVSERYYTDKITIKDKVYEKLQPYIQYLNLFNYNLFSYFYEYILGKSPFYKIDKYIPYLFFIPGTRSGKNYNIISYTELFNKYNFTNWNELEYCVPIENASVALETIKRVFNEKQNKRQFNKIYKTIIFIIRKPKFL